VSYEIITYSPDTGTDEHGDYRTQKEARQGLKLCKQEAAALIYDLDRWRIVYRRGYWPTGALPIEGGATLDYLFRFAAPNHDYLGDGEKILNTTSARPWSNPGRIFCALYSFQRVRPCPYTPRARSAACAPFYGPQAEFLRPCPAGRSMSQNARPP